jgi:hypothetical protein
LVLQRDDWPTSYIDHMGFTLIALFEGFIIVAAIVLGAPGWLTAGVAILGVIVGNNDGRAWHLAGRRPGDVRAPGRVVGRARQHEKEIREPVHVLQ